MSGAKLPDETLVPVEHPRGKAWLMMLLGAGLLVATALGIYLPTLDYDFIFDDVLGIVSNESIQQLTPLFGEAGGHGPLNPKPNTPLSARPVISLTFAVNYHFGGLKPAGYRLTHIVIHILSAFLLWAMIAETLRRPCLEGRFARYRHELAFISAMLWMVHPTHTETVIYLTQRTELLMGFFYFLTIFCAIRYWASERIVVRGLWCLAALLASVCGMLSKEMMASVPAMILMYDWTFIRGSAFSILKRSWPLYLVLVLSWTPLVMIYQWGYVTPLAGFNNTISAPDFWLTQANSFFVYWKLLLWPWPLLLHYEVPTLTTFSQAWPGVIAMGIYAVVTTGLVWRRHPLGYGLLFFFAALSPTLIVPLPNEEISERRMYVATAAVLPLLIAGAYSLARWLRGGQQTDGKQSGSEITTGRFWVSQLPCLAMVMAFIGVCVISSPRLADRAKIWEAVLEYQPENLFATAAQGAVEFNRGEKEAGLVKMHQAFDADPSYPYHVMLLIKAYRQLNQPDRLIETYRTAIVASPDNDEYLLDLATLLADQGNAEEASELFKRVIELVPDHDVAHSKLAVVLAEHRQADLAIEHFQRAVEINPDTFNCTNLMGAHLRRQENEQAIEAAKMLLKAARKEKKEKLVIRVEQALKRLAME